MSEEEDHVDVVLETVENAVEDAPKVEIVEEKAETPVVEEKKAEVTPDEGIQELKKSLEREKNARAEAERRAREAAVSAKKAQENTAEAQLQLVTNALETVKERSESLKQAYADAMSVGDYAKGAEIQEAMATNTHQLERLKEGRKAMKKQMKEAEESAAQQIHPVSPPQGDIVDQLASNVSQRSAEWLRNSRDHIRNDRDVRKMFRAHEDAIDDGLQPDTDEYFEFIENRMGIGAKVDDTSKKEVVENPMSSASAPTQKRSTQPPPAPVSRGTPRPNTMRLTKEEAETARMMGYTPEEYAKNKALLMKEGRYGH